MDRQILLRLERAEAEIERIKAAQAAGVWQPWSPTLDQGGAVAITVNYARYALRGNTVVLLANLTVNGAGTATFMQVQGLPFPPAYSAFELAAGVFMIRDASGPTNYAGSTILSNATSLRFRVDQTGGNGLGQAPAMTLANEDTLGFSAVYERG